MSHHLVTVCMFCLLCAAHTCGSHIKLKEDIKSFEPSLQIDQIPIHLEKRSIESKLRYQQKLQKIRHKREVRNVNPDAYVEQIFRLYGDAGSMTMNLTGFNRMLEGLDLHKLTEGGVQKIENKDYIYGQSGVKEDVVNVSVFD